jgi:uncharacterized protein YegP (UPF0339 family)
MFCWKRPKYHIEVVPSMGALHWFWRMKAANGETLCTSEMYTTEAAAYETAAKVAKAKITVVSKTKFPL